MPPRKKSAADEPAAEPEVQTAPGQTYRATIVDDEAPAVEVAADDLHAASPETDPHAAVWTELAKPFPVEWIEKLPKPLRRNDEDKGRCEPGVRYSADGHFCGGWHSRSVHLDYVGHAGITMRLNRVLGPGGWSLEPIAVTEAGTPFIPARGEFWARLTIHGVSKVDVAANYNSTQEAWGDALRRCAMRFGIGTYLWAKSEYAAELAQHREPEPGQEPERLAQETADRLVTFTGDPTVLANVLAVSREAGHTDLEVSFRGERMLLEVAIVTRVQELTDAAERVAAAAAIAAQEQAANPIPVTETPDAAEPPAQGEPAQAAPIRTVEDALLEECYAAACAATTVDELRAVWRRSAPVRDRVVHDAQMGSVQLGAFLMARQADEASRAQSSGPDHAQRAAGEATAAAQEAALAAQETFGTGPSS